MVSQSHNYSVIYNLECKNLIKSLLNIDIGLRPLVDTALTYEWTIAEPSTRPLSPAQCKYTSDTCLPTFLQKVKSRSTCNPESSCGAAATNVPSCAIQTHQQNSNQFVINNSHNNASQVQTAIAPPLPVAVNNTCTSASRTKQTSLSNQSVINNCLNCSTPYQSAIQSVLSGSNQFAINSGCNSTIQVQTPIASPQHVVINHTCNSASQTSSSLAINSCLNRSMPSNLRRSRSYQLAVQNVCSGSILGLPNGVSCLNSASSVTDNENMATSSDLSSTTQQHRGLRRRITSRLRAVGRTFANSLRGIRRNRR